MWETFGPKVPSSKYRPFGDAVVDGFDFDLETPVPRLDTFAKHLRKLMNQASGSSKTKSRKKFYLTAAPQCPFPDQNVGTILNNVALDAVFVQFYNNPLCGLNAFSNGQAQGFNFEKWDQWARTTAKNKKVKVLVGAPASQDAAGSGYVDGDQLRAIVKYSQKFKSLGGVMIWDSSHLAGNQGLLMSLSEIIKGLLPPYQASKDVTLFTTITTTYCPEPSSLYNTFHSQTTQVRQSTPVSHASQNSDSSTLLQSFDNDGSLSLSPSPHSTRSSTAKIESASSTKLLHTTTVLQTQKPQRTVYLTTWVRPTGV